jgi:polyisoprenyl-teichoic acid--peptidoglycan teichoic acid transferase
MPTSATKVRPIDPERPPSLWWGMWKRFLVAGALIVLLSGAATAAVTLNKATTIAQEVFQKLNQIKTPRGLITPYNGGPATFLVLGSDRRAGSTNAEERDAAPHSDTILLVRFDPEQGQTSVLSIPRDLLVSIAAPGGRVYYPEKINFAYTLGSLLPEHDGGANLAAETIKRELPGLQLAGIIDVTFKGFIDVVDKLGCVYLNVDHRYFNEKNGSPETNYANINLQPGYQKLCYENALEYVRYRHDDSDFVRVARQQDFLRSLREQISTSNLIGEIDGIAKAVGHAISSNLSPSAALLIRLAKLIAFSQEKPLRQVPFLHEEVNYQLNGGSYVTTSPYLAHKTLENFLYGTERLELAASPQPTHGYSSHPHGRRHSHSHSHPQTSAAYDASLDLYPTSAVGQNEVITAAPSVPLKVLYPALQTGPAAQQEVRPYALRDRQGQLHHAYVVVWEQNIEGGYYDFEGTDWLDPPIVAHPDEERTIGARTYMFFSDGSHIHMIAWRESKALYWVVNTLLEELSNSQMLAIARSAEPLH